METQQIRFESWTWQTALELVNCQSSICWKSMAVFLYLIFFYISYKNKIWKINKNIFDTNNTVSFLGKLVNCYICSMEMCLLVIILTLNKVHHLTFRLKHLTYLSLCFCDHISENGIEILGQMHTLTSLDISGCKVTDKVSTIYAEYL